MLFLDTLHKAVGTIKDNHTMIVTILKGDLSVCKNMTFCFLKGDLLHAKRSCIASSYVASGKSKGKVL